MNITVSDINFGVRVPKVKPKKIELPDFFRDSELFDSSKDKVTDEYFKYGVDDIHAGINKINEEKDISQEILERSYEYYPPYNDVVKLYEENTHYDDSLPDIFEHIR